MSVAATTDVEAAAGTIPPTPLPPGTASKTPTPEQLTRLAQGAAGSFGDIVPGDHDEHMLTNVGNQGKCGFFCCCFTLLWVCLQCLVIIPGSWLSSTMKNGVDRAADLLKLKLRKNANAAAAKHQNDLEWLHRYNILFLRAQLLGFQQSKKGLLDEATLEQVGRDLDRYSTAMRNYRHFRDDGHLFPHDEAFNQTVTDMSTLFEMETQQVPPDDRMHAQRVADLRMKTHQDLVKAIHMTPSGITAQGKQRANRALVSRLLMALGGGLALVGPMLVMVLHPTRLTAVLTTSCCVIAAAVCLAVFMEDSQPKDVVACTAAYAAVLVVFVGAGVAVTD